MNWLVRKKLKPAMPMAKAIGMPASISAKNRTVRSSMKGSELLVLDGGLVGIGGKDQPAGPQRDGDLDEEDEAEQRRSRPGRRR